MELQDIKIGGKVKLVRVFGTPVRERVIGEVKRIGYSRTEVEVVHDYDGGGFDFWPIADVVPVVECTTCGEPATHYVAFVDTKTLKVASMNGPGYVTPSCDNCDGVDRPDADLVAVRSEAL
jgi:hypothetical protein